ncbi:mannose-6-phosphate isomerase, class I [Psittacicella melopsittaci]|uniref:mannose-6-phosphate isomerase n=1 Tax=Psittacicella melopsittaci TaxID=2028576 RepID=A0A3A1Y895_9GAMM|nr:mannose-6-phosphate isomerase, class I [Psittacicella melopsittaci]RIY32334.1 mannose-6-phosphate isomerase, class I [Psittacicella melopsittaci]
MLTNIFLVILIVGAILLDFRTNLYLKVTKEAKAVINYKRELKPFVLVFIALMIFAIFKSQDDVFTQTLAFIVMLLVIKISYLNPHRIVVNENSVATKYGVIPNEAIADFKVDEKNQLVIQIQGMPRAFKFKPKGQKDFDTILYCAEKLNLGNAKEVIQRHRLAQIASQARGVFLLHGVTKDYDWGGKEYLAQEYGLEKQQIAEVWYGTHPSGQASIVIPGAQLEYLTSRFYAQNPNQDPIEVDAHQDYNVLLNYNIAYGQPLVQGQDEQVRNEGLPFLFKILDVARPLSIQIHPDKQTAEQGYAQEDKLGINLKSANRTFKDKNHKPEFGMALTPMYLLHGFDSKENVLAKLEGKPALAQLKEFIASRELGQAYAELFTKSKAELKELLGEHIQTAVELYDNLIERQLEAADITTFTYDQDGLNVELANQDPDYWVAFTYKSLCMELDNLDVGLISFYIFNLVKLEPFQGIYQGPNIPHAYLRGRLVEVMANSDNVVRGGLTTKHINSELYLRLVDTQAVTPKIYAQGDYDLPSEEFTYKLVELNNNDTYQTDNASIWYFLNAQGTLEFNDQSVHAQSLAIKSNQAVFASVDRKVTYKGEKALVVIASVK